MKILLVIVSMIFCQLGLAEEPAPANPPAPTPDLIAKGQAAYKASCVGCHGDQGKGDGAMAKYLNPPPRNFWKDAFKNGDCLPQLFDTLTKGMPPSSMPNWAALTEEQRWGLAYVVKDFETQGGNSHCDSPH